MFRHLRVGDTIARNMAGIVKSGKVLFVEEDILYWKDNDFPLEEKEELWPFDRDHGWEYDEEMGWGYKFGVCISHLIQEN